MGDTPPGHNVTGCSLVGQTPSSRLLLPDQTSILFFRHAIATSRHMLDAFAIEDDQAHFVKSALTNFEPFP
jgi:hypothetical protein